MKAQPIALVTGATSGIGEATAYRLQARDYLVFAVGRNPAALDKLRSRGLQARTLEVTDEAAATRLVEEIQPTTGVWTSSSTAPDSRFPALSSRWP